MSSSSPSRLAAWALLMSVMLLQTVAVQAQTAKETASSILSSTDKIKIGPSILAIIAIAVGAIVCLAGYRLFRYTIFVCGFIVGGLAVASAIEWIFKNQSWMATASWIGFFVGGLLLGLFAMSLYTTSIFVAGAAGGVLLAFTIHNTVTYKIYPEHPTYVLVALAVILGIVCGVLALKLEKPVLVIATSFVGAVATVWGIGYFAGEFPNAADLEFYRSKAANGDWQFSLPAAWWGYLAGILVLFAFGMMMQFRKTGRDGNYHSVGRKQQTNASAAVPASYENLDTPPVQGGNPRYGNPVAHV
ncbi:hypothetical protein PINS_up005633 [Pythium insidiosum]|nr:hypothetical protein PINS_up005633 [Pythium insidiosum]